MKSRKYIDGYGDIRYLNDQDQSHRLSGPSDEYSNGSKFWCVNGYSHRIYGHSVEYFDGVKSWWANDKAFNVFKRAY